MHEKKILFSLFTQITIKREKVFYLRPEPFIILKEPKIDRSTLKTEEVNRKIT